MSFLNEVVPNRLARFCAVLFFVMVLVTFTCGLKADEWNKKTVMTFNEPLEIAGQVLPAGTYVFKLVDSPSDRHIVQILNKEENHVFMTVPAIPQERVNATAHTEVAFAERPAGQPQALRSWFYPGDLVGQDFVASKYPGALMAKASPPAAPVASAPTSTTETTMPPEPETKTPVAEPAPQPSEVTPAPEPSPYVMRNHRRSPRLRQRLLPTSPRTPTRIRTIFLRQPVTCHLRDWRDFRPSAPLRCWV